MFVGLRLTDKSKLLWRWGCWISFALSFVLLLGGHDIHARETDHSQLNFWLKQGHVILKNKNQLAIEMFGDEEIPPEVLINFKGEGDFFVFRHEDPQPQLLHVIGDQAYFQFFEPQLLMGAARTLLLLPKEHDHDDTNIPSHPLGQDSSINFIFRQCGFDRYHLGANPCDEMPERIWRRTDLLTLVRDHQLRAETWEQDLVIGLADLAKLDVEQLRSWRQGQMVSFVHDHGGFMHGQLRYEAQAIQSAWAFGAFEELYYLGDYQTAKIAFEPRPFDSSWVLGWRDQEGAYLSWHAGVPLEGQFRLETSLMMEEQEDVSFQELRVQNDFVWSERAVQWAVGLHDQDRFGTSLIALMTPEVTSWQWGLALDLGLGLNTQNPYGKFGATVRHDLTSNIHGLLGVQAGFDDNDGLWQTTFEVSRSFPSLGGQVGLGVKGDWVEDDLKALIRWTWNLQKPVMSSVSGALGLEDPQMRRMRLLLAEWQGNKEEALRSQVHQGWQRAYHSSN